MKPTVGGQLTYAALAQLHRPIRETELAREAQRLRDQGLTERDIGQALMLDPTAVRKLLTEVMP